MNAVTRPIITLVLVVLTLLIGALIGDRQVHANFNTLLIALIGGYVLLCETPDKARKRRDR